MIYKWNEDNVNVLMEIWLQTNIDAHDFIDASYWKENYEMVKEMLPQADLYVYDKESKVVGFVGVMDNYIAGIFVSKEYQSNGIGKQLLNHCKDIYDTLSLSVYSKNVVAINFYEKNGFKKVSTSIDEDTSEKEITMKWSK